MSIQPGRVLWRIVDEVDRAPRVRLARSVQLGGSRRTAGDERLEVVRVAARGSDGAPPFATLLHFWTHALREWLDATGQADQLVGAAGYAMCEGLGETEGLEVLAGLAARLPPSSRDLQLSGGVVEAYRMIEGSCRASYVLATDDEWVSVTWGHGFVRAALPSPKCSAARDWRLHRAP